MAGSGLAGTTRLIIGAKRLRLPERYVVGVWPFVGNAPPG